jgi:hypothetical protein
MIDLQDVMNESAEVRARTWKLWDRLQKAEAKGAEVRNQIALEKRRLAELRLKVKRGKS